MWHIKNDIYIIEIKKHFILLTEKNVKKMLKFYISVLCKDSINIRNN